MKIFPKDEQAKHICAEWAEDFRKRGMWQDFLLWYAVALAFDIGGTVEEDAVVAKIDRAIRTKMDTAKMVAFAPKKIRKALFEISEEAKYLHTVLFRVNDYPSM
ncbi:hypothetical protein AB6N16_24785 [Pseudomonas marginalis]